MRPTDSNDLKGKSWKEIYAEYCKIEYTKITYRTPRFTREAIFDDSVLWKDCMRNE